jgi:hypothetical protein
MVTIITKSPASDPCPVPSFPFSRPYTNLRFAPPTPKMEKRGPADQLVAYVPAGPAMAERLIVSYSRPSPLVPISPRDPENGKPKVC